MDKKITKCSVLKVESCFKIKETYLFKLLLKDKTIYPTNQDFLTLKDVDNEIIELVKKFHNKHGDVYPTNISRSVFKRFKIQGKDYKC